MAGFELVSNAITKEVLKYDTDKIHILTLQDGLRVRIETVFFDGLWVVCRDRVISKQISIREEKQESLIDMEYMSKDLNRIRQYERMLKTMQGKLIKQ